MRPRRGVLHSAVRATNWTFDECLHVSNKYTLFFFCFPEERLESEITNVRPLKCPHGPILTNVTLRHELRAGKFSRLGMAADMDTCIQMCCDRDDCEMAFMPGRHCFGVDCFSEKHCEITTVKPGNLTVKIAAVRPIVVNPAKDQIAGVLNIHRSGNFTYTASRSQTSLVFLFLRCRSSIYVISQFSSSIT